ncbi:MAG: hypothetical protein IKK75_05175 [Clostridia bacterium]|nr:hypothetical protein [Clostridia bacterium]
MKNYLLLLRVNLKTMLRSMVTQGIRGDKGRIRLSYVILYIVAAIGFVSMAAMVIWMETAVYRVAADISGLVGLSLPQLLMGLAVLISMVITLVFGVFHTMGAMYFNRDTVATAHLPISPRTQMAARWTEIYLGEILISLVFLLPMLINHGIATGGGVLYYAGAVATLMAVPLYPLSVALLLSAVLARFSGITRNKEAWMVIGTILMLVVVLGSEWMLLPNIPEDADATFFLRLLLDNEELLNLVVGAFPPVLWAIHGLDGNAAMLLLFILVSAAGITLVIYLTGGSFQQICIRHTEHATARKRLRRRVKESFDAATPFTAIFRREMNEVLKTPVYLLNGVMGVLMMPIMLVAMFVGASSAEADGGAAVTQMVTELLEKVSVTDVMLVITGLFAFMLFMCPITSTAISREGKRLPIMRMIPVSPLIILWAKLMVGMVIVGFGSVVMGLAFAILLGWEYLPCIIGAVLLSNILSVTVNISNITVDVVKPVLSWKSENEAMKQNFNVMFGMLIGVVAVAIVAVPVGLLHAFAPWVRLLTAVALILAEAGVSLLILHKLAAPALSRLEP